MDGVDAALVRIGGSGLNTKIELLAFETFPYPPGLRERLLEISTPGRGTVEEVCRLNVVVGEIFADAARRLMQNTGQRADLIGSHGQTIQHLPGPEEHFGYTVRATLQIGEPAVIAKRTGIITVADFRPADMAVGGQGAPLVPYFDFLIFRSAECSRLLLNIGGIANVTLLPRSCQVEDVTAFDTGPGNMVIDGLIKRLFGMEFDRDGRVSRQGNVHRELLEWALAFPFFQRPPPKSTGREEFGEAFIEEFLLKAHHWALKDEDIVATAVALTAESIHRAYGRFVESKTKVDELIVSGGGRHNVALMEALRRLFAPISVRTSDEFGVPSDAKEAMCFAVLANETVSGIPSNLPGATGAREPVVLGKICL